MSPLAFILVIVVAFIAGVASVVDERQFHRPLVACTLMGFALGDVRAQLCVESAAFGIRSGSY